MASFWDRIKALFGRGPSVVAGETPPPSAVAGGAGSATAGAVTAPAPAEAPGKTQAAPPPAVDLASKDPLDTGVILGLSATELRRRALRIRPYQTAWIGRVDTIPPESDERTALIDRGLVLRGFLTRGELDEIHRVGDVWLMHHEAAKMAEIAAALQADKAIAARREERAAKRAEKKRQAEARREERAAEILRRKAEDILYLGPGVSSFLSDRRSNLEALSERGLPLLSTPADVARAIEVTIPELRYLCFHSEASEHPHYVYFEIPKRSSGKRLLAAPRPKLARAQAFVLHAILEKLRTEEQAHGFVKGRSTVTCAAPHVGRDLVVNLDLADFFPSIHIARVRGVFRRLGYSPAVSSILALLCTEAPRTAAVFEGRRYWVAVGPRALPQGAATSPALSNQIARKLDRRLAGVSKKYGFSYTRYADDLTFSAPPGKREELPMFLARVRHIIDEEGFTLNPKKGRIQRSGRRQSVTGLVVNRKPSVPREEMRALRAILHHAKTTGLAAQNRANVPDFAAHLAGRIAYVHMVDPGRAAPLQAALSALLGRSGPEDREPSPRGDSGRSPC